MKITIIERTEDKVFLKCEKFFTTYIVGVNAAAYDSNPVLFQECFKQIITENIYGFINYTILKVGIACIMLYGLSKLLGF